MDPFAFVLAATAIASTPHCVSEAEAHRLLAPTREEPTPLGLILGAGSDWGAKYLVVSTTHHLGVPLIPGTERSQSVTYYAVSRERTCAKEIELAACPQLSLDIDAYRGRSYSVMYNRTRLREGAAFHPPFSLLHVKDGDGNVARIFAGQSQHPLHHDAAQTFSSIKSCTKDVDDLAGGL